MKSLFVSPISAAILSFPFLVLLGLLTSCFQGQRSGPRFVGTFEGFVAFANDALPAGLRLNIILGEVTKEQYSFTGEAFYNGQRYHLKGTETASGPLEYLQPTNVAVAGHIEAALLDGAATAYRLSLVLPYNFEHSVRTDGVQGWLYEGDEEREASGEVFIRWVFVDGE